MWEKFEDIEGVIIFCKPKKNRQYNGKDNNPQHTTHNKTNIERHEHHNKLMCSEMASTSCSTSRTRRVTAFKIPVFSPGLAVICLSYASLLYFIC